MQVKQIYLIQYYLEKLQKSGVIVIWRKKEISEIMLQFINYLC